MRIHEIPAGDEPLTRRFWEIGRAADEQGRPWSGYGSWEAARASFHASLASDGCRTMLTGNADVNVAMNAVNERLGFGPVERVLEMQKRLGRP